MIDFGDFERHNPLGLFLPPGVGEDRPRPEIRHVGAYLTYSELTAAMGRPHTMTEEELITRLERLSAADCMAHIGFMASTMHASPGPYFRPEVQRELIGSVVGLDTEVGQVLDGAIEQQDEQMTIFCEQQLIHLARLVGLHARSYSGFRARRFEPATVEFRTHRKSPICRDSGGRYEPATS